MTQEYFRRHDAIIAFNFHHPEEPPKEKRAVVTLDKLMKNMNQGNIKMHEDAAVLVVLANHMIGTKRKNNKITQKPTDPKKPERKSANKPDDGRRSPFTTPEQSTWRTRSSDE